MNQELMDKAWHMACAAEGYATSEVPDWAIQMVSDTQLEIYNKLETQCPEFLAWCFEGDMNPNSQAVFESYVFRETAE
jgi:hypothetical protein